MENIEAKNFIDRYEEALDTTPQEVRDFLWSDAYKGIIAGIAKTLNITAQQETVVSDVIFDIVIGAIDQPEVDEKLTASGISIEDQAKILALAAENIIDPSIIEAENITDSNEEGGVAESQPTNLSSSAPTPTEVLASLGARLSQSSVIVPSKRDYTVYKPVPSEPSVQNIAPSMDPYRELPEK